ncbi:MAG: ROK family protein [Erysipelotrichaceae bacterium]|nr:ROK family protein [Erysipelotrichaceae bacterium]
MEKYLCIDLSRTKLRYAIVSEKLDTTAEGTEYIGINSREEVFDPIKEVADRYRDEVEGVSITMPGVIDPKRGFAYSGGVFEWVRDTEYAKELSEYIDMPVVICNDAKSAALAEVGYGALKKVQNGVLLMILNTGIGGAVITDGHILNGHHFAAGEFSYMKGDYQRREGYQDMFALSTSLDGLTRLVEESSGKKNLNVLRICSKMAMGDEDVKKGVEEYCDRLAVYIYNIQCVVDADVFVIGGHLTDDPNMVRMIQQSVDKIFANDRFKNIFKPVIKQCVFHDNSRRYGAVYNYRMQTGKIASE